MGKKTNYVTRRCVEKRVIDVFSLKNGKLTKLETLETKGKISQKELAKKHGVDNVVLEVVKEERAVYGVPIDEFMKIAKRVDNVEESEE